MKTFVTTLLTIAIIDAGWLFSMGGWYKTKLAHLFASSPNFIPAILFYLIYAAGLSYFVINPAVKNGMGWMQIAATGAFFGLVAYATYDLTNQATLKSWPFIVTFVDMAWGAVLSAVVSLFVVWISRS